MVAEANTESCVSLVESAGQRGLVLRGSVGIFSADELHRAAVQLLRSGKDVTVSCEHVDRLDTSALQVVLSLKQAVHQNGRSFHLVNVPSTLRECLTSAGLWDVLQDQTPVNDAAHVA
jgi:anti-anti-sigma factor